MITVNTHEAKTHFSTLISSVENDNETILVCRNGHPIAEIHPLSRSKPHGLPKANKKLSAIIKYDPTEQLDDDYIPEVCR